MNNGVVVAFLNNAALLLALVILYEMIFRPLTPATRHKEIIVGFIIGLIGIAVMMNPWQYSPGVIFDTRATLLGITGLFFGLLPSIVAMIITGAYRMYVGGQGALAGVALVIAATVWGLFWRSYRVRLKQYWGRFELLIFGIVLHMIQILLILLIPKPTGWILLQAVTVPIITIFPLLTLLLGTLMDNRLQIITNAEGVRASERRFRKMMERSSDIIILIDAEGVILDITDSVHRILGYRRPEIIGTTAFDLIHPDDLPLMKETVRSIVSIQGFSGMLEFRVHSKTGDYIWIGAVVSNMLDDPDVGAIVANSRDISGRKAAEDELRTFSRRLSLATEAGKIGIWEYDMTNGMFIWDDRMYEMYGIDRNVRMSYDQWLETVHPDDRAMIHNRVQDAIAGREGYHAQYRIICPHRRVCHVEARGVVYRDQQGDPKRMTGVNWDITSHVQAEERLRESEARFRFLVENAPDAIYVQTAMRFVYLNSRAVELFGAKSVDELLGKPVMELIHSDFRAIVTKRHQMVTAENRSIPILEEMYLRLDGSPVEVEVTAVPVEYGGKNDTLVFVRDISERKQAEQSLKDSEEQYRHIFNTMMNGFALHEIICDDTGQPADYRFLEVNPAFERMTGLHGADIIGKTVLEVLPGTEPIWIERYGRVALTGEPVMFENISEVLGKYYHVTAYSPRQRQFAVIFDDITELKRVEKEREQIENQLRQAQKMEAIGRLAGGVAHDFNNMLNVILGNAEIALTQLDPGNSLSMELQEIKKAGERSAMLTRQLLAFSRKQLVEPKIINLNEVITSQKIMLDRLIGEDIRIVFIPSKSIWNIRIDPYQIAQILANLAINARDAINGVGKITIETANLNLDESYSQRNVYVEPGEYVMMSFADTGAGMDSETQEQIFEPFFTTKDEGSGTGLGLSTVYGIVKQNSGLINVYSEPDMGTIFKVYFPRHAGAAATLPKKPVEIPLHGSETILIVEDEIQILDLTRKMLTNHGYCILTARTPTEAFNLAAQRKGDIHLLLTDVVMPTMNGRELEEKIRYEVPGIKTLFMSGYTANVIAERGVIDKDVNFIHKPFTISGLVEKVRAVLDS